MRMMAAGVALETGPARAEDLPRLVELLGVLFAQEADFTPDPERQRRGLQAILAEPSAGSIHVAREGGAVIGMVVLLHTVSTAEGGRVAWLEDLVVDPSCRGRGVGRLLLRHAIAQARAAGLLRLTLLTDADNERARALYASEGFAGSAMRPMRLSLRG